MKRILSAIAVLTAFMGFQALAADLPLKAPPAPIWDWSGWYIGGFGGGAWGYRGSATDPVTTGPAPGGGGVPIGSASLGSAPWSYPLGAGGLGGGIVGFNWQVPNSRVVLGGEVEGGYLRVSGAGSPPTSFFPVAGSPCPNPPFLTACASASTRVGNWYVAETVRAGWLWTPALLTYGKIGAAESQLSGAWNFNCAPCGALLAPSINTNLAASKGIVGVVAGGGFEYMISPRWTVKAEYEFLGFGGASVQPSGPLGCVGCIGIAGTPLRGTNTLQSGINIVTVGLNYKLTEGLWWPH